MIEAVTCLDLRRSVTANPKANSTEQEQHLNNCNACHHFVMNLQQQNRQLLHALEVPVPDGLSERILLKQRNSFYIPWKSLMIAASAVMVLGVLGKMSWNHPLPSKDWAMIAAQHVASEPNSLTSKNTIPENNLKSALAEWGLSLQAPVQNIQYLARCPLPNGTGLHFVFQSAELGKISVILPPQNTTLTTNRKAQYGEYHSAGLRKGNQILTVISDDELKLHRAKNWVSEQLVLL